GIADQNCAAEWDGHDVRGGADRREQVKIIRGKRKRAEPGGKRGRDETASEANRFVQKNLPARAEFVGQEGIELQEVLDQFVECGHHEDDAEDDAKGELEAGLKELLRLPQQDDERGGE